MFSLSYSGASTDDLAQSGLDHLFNQLLRPRLRPLLSDVYKDISYVLTEEGYSEAEYRDDVRKRFIKSWEAMLAGYRVSAKRSSRVLLLIGLSRNRSRRRITTCSSLLLSTYSSDRGKE